MITKKQNFVTNSFNFLNAKETKTAKLVRIHLFNLVIK